MQTGIEKIDKWAKIFGLGEKTGIEIPEYAGYRNNEETMKLKESDIHHIWSDSDTAQSSIGQLYNLFTPIQLSTYAAALSNGGYLNTPRLIASSVTKEGTVTKYEPIRSKIDVKQSTLNTIREGMVEMINLNSTAKVEFSGFRDGFVAGKTGTPETGLEAFGRSSHSVFICYAPADDPQIAVSVVLEHGARGVFSIPVAGEVVRAYFGDNSIGNGLPSRKEGISFGFRNFESIISQG